jgi:ubiquinone/menaquinone biosynthesis C-methylase UbiE
MLKKLFWFPISSKENIEKYQKKIREYEWNEYSKFIPSGAKFLDVGCGAGYNIEKAYLELKCEVYGIDPEPGEHGVGRFSNLDLSDKPIFKANAEKIPFNNNEFDVVFSSHVLEHVNSIDQSLSEMNRVLKKEGVLIIGMPTTSMSVVALISHYLFTTHINILNFIKSFGSGLSFEKFKHIFIPRSHSFPIANFIGYDLKNYSINNWRKLISKHFRVDFEITPGLYPYPDYIQWFPFIKFKNYSSSVFFICKKKND